MFYKRLLITVFLLALAGVALAGTPNVNYVSIRALSMGGPGITTMNDFSALMYNPAQLAKCDFHLDIINIQARLGKDILDMVDFYNDNQEVFDNFTDTTLEEQNKLLDGLAKFDDKWVGFGGYPTIGFSVHNFALGAYGAADLDLKTDKGIFEPRVYLHGVADYVLSAGLAFEMPDVLRLGVLNNNFYGGASFKYITRYHVDERLKASDIDFGDIYDTLITDKKTGFGVDLGVLYDLVPDKISLGMKVTDIVAKIGDEKPATVFNVGASWQLTKSLLLAADYNDFFFHRGENIFNKLNFGAELALGRILFLRGGFGQGYPACGAGLNLGIITIDGAIYGIEKTDAPGGEGDYNYALRFKLGV